MEKSFEEHLIYAQQQLSPYTATGKYLRKICDNFLVEYSDNEPDSVIRDRFLSQVCNYKKEKPLIVQDIVIYGLFKEVSDQYGKSELVKTFATKELAEKYQKTIKDRRSYIAELSHVVSIKN